MLTSYLYLSNKSLIIIIRPSSRSLCFVSGDKSTAGWTGVGHVLVDVAHKGQRSAGPEAKQAKEHADHPALA